MRETKALDEFFDMRRKHATNCPDAWWELEYINKATSELASMQMKLMNQDSDIRHYEKWRKEDKAEIVQLRAELDEARKGMAEIAIEHSKKKIAAAFLKAYPKELE
jgi:hypothetical protein